MTGTALKLVLVGAVAFLQGAFVWVITYNPVLDAFYGENGRNGVAIWLRDATISMTWLPSMSRLIDYLCMAALVVVFCCVYLLSEGPRLLDALAVSMSLMVELGFIVLFFDLGGPLRPLHRLVALLVHQCVRIGGLHACPCRLCAPSP